MSVAEVQKIAGSEVVFALLFIMFLMWYLKKSSAETEAQREADIARDTYMNELHKEREATLKAMMAEQRKDTLAREAELSSNMRRMVEQQERIGDVLKEVSGGLVDLEKKVDNNVLEIWKVVASNNPPKT